MPDSPSSVCMSMGVIRYEQCVREQTLAIGNHVYDSDSSSSSSSTSSTSSSTTTSTTHLAVHRHLLMPPSPLQHCSSREDVSVVVVVRLPVLLTLMLEPP